MQNEWLLPPSLWWKRPVVAAIRYPAITVFTRVNLRPSSLQNLLRLFIDTRTLISSPAEKPNQANKNIHRKHALPPTQKPNPTFKTQFAVFWSWKEKKVAGPWFFHWIPPSNLSFIPGEAGKPTMRQLTVNLEKAYVQVPSAQSEKLKPSKILSNFNFEWSVQISIWETGLWFL